MSVSITAENLSVRYRVHLDRERWWKKNQSPAKTEVVALDDVSFEIGRGEAWGVIGRNGAGKSTLLRVLGGTLKPDGGSVTVNGRMSALLSLGVGFNPQLSGRRNIYLGALANGLTTKQIDGAFDEIVEFAGIEDAIDRPIKTYSSGMVARLGFSTGIHLDPEILLLDEVFSVGDEEFSERSYAAIMKLLEKSSTLVFVSHQLASVVSLCESAIWLADGAVQAIGRSDEVVTKYRSAVLPKSSALAHRQSEQEAWTANQKMELILRLLAGDRSDMLGREFGASTDQIRDWRAKFIEGGKAALKAPRASGGEDAS